jgi:hypothetical protein
MRIFWRPWTLLAPAVAVTLREVIFRRVEFLFSRDRMNVTISRARCLAYLVCTEELLNTRPGEWDSSPRSVPSEYSQG